MYNVNSTDYLFRRIQRTIRLVLWVFVFLLILFLTFRYYVPFGRLNIFYDVKHGSAYVNNFASKERDRLIGTPNKKGSDSEYFQLITKTPLYFDVLVPRPFQKATVTLQYQNPDSQSVIRLGVRQGGTSAFAYRDMAFAEPILDNLPYYWDKIQQGDTVLWQKNNELLKLEKNLNEQKKKELELFDAQQTEKRNTVLEKVKNGQLTSNDLASLDIDLKDARETETLLLENKYSINSVQRPKPQYTSIDDFLHSQPNPRTTLLYNYSLPPQVDLSYYQPSQNQTVIEPSTRGSHEIETIIGNGETLHFEFTIQNINRHEGKDSFQVQVWDGVHKQAEEVIQEYGSKLPTGNPSQQRIVVIEKGGLQAGVYTLKVITNDDVFIKRIETSQHLLRYKKKLYLTDNSEYKDLLGEKIFTPTKLITNGTWVAASTSHADSLQKITVGNKKLVLTDIMKESRVDNLNAISQIIVPSNDVSLITDGAFAFSKEQYFQDPINYQNFSDNVDLKTVDYILAQYPVAKQDDNWLKASATIDGKELYFKKGTIGFIIDTPGLPENKRILKIRSIRIQFEKEPWTFPKIWNKIKTVLKKR